MSEVMMSARASFRALQDKVVVVTGASSGIGRAAALEFARGGARLVLAARRSEALTQIAKECSATGGHALAVPTDVTMREQVNQLASTAIEEFGHIDIWVNNAAVLMMGRFEDAPLDALRRVMETNFFGRVYGVRAALQHFRSRQRGILIDVGSVLGTVPQPYASAYIASKFAGRGLLQSLRIELFDSPEIHVCSVLPAPIDTPIYQQAANFTGHEVRPIWPMYDPRVVAKAIFKQAVSPRRQVIAGNLGRLLRLAHIVSPTITEYLARVAVDAMQLGRTQVPHTCGNLNSPLPELTNVNGGWRARYRHSRPWRLALSAVLLVGFVSATSYARRRTGIRKSVTRRCSTTC